MAFQIKNFTSIVASMMNIIRSTQNNVTDFEIGGVARTIIEAPSAEIDELYQQMFIGLTEAIPVSVYNSFEFDAITALPTAGLIRVSITASAALTVIPAATTFLTGAGTANYLSNNDVSIAAGNTFADVLVTCDTPGSFANIAAGQSFTAAPTIQGFISATNLSAFITGTDAETPDDQKSRFNAFVSSLNRGTVAALQYGLNLAFLLDSAGNKTERVVTSTIIEPWLLDDTQPVSLVNCYIHNGVGSTSSALVAQAVKVIYGYYDATGTAVPGWKAAGVNVQIFAATEVAVVVTGALTVAAGYDKPTLLVLAQQVIYSYILGLGVGSTLIQAELVTLVMAIAGVTNITYSTPTVDTSATSSTKLMPGAITLV